jgi:hypothetical protein
VARNVPELAGGADQVERLPALFPGYHAVFGPAIDRAGAETSRALRQHDPVAPAGAPGLQPSAAAARRPGIKHMPRQATEIVAETPAGPCAS